MSRVFAGLVALFLAFGCSAGEEILVPQVPPRVCLLGSSSASGIGASRVTRSYAGRLSTWLSSYRSDIALANFGCAGYTTCEARPYGMPWVAYCPDPDTFRNVDAARKTLPYLVIVHFPSNDASLGISVEQSLANLDTILGSIEAAGARALVVGAQPRPYTGGTLGRQLAWARALDTLKRAEVVRIWDSVALDSSNLRPELTSDGIHLNDSGHALLARMILRSRAWQEVVGDTLPD